MIQIVLLVIRNPGVRAFVYITYKYAIAYKLTLLHVTMCVPVSSKIVQVCMCAHRRHISDCANAQADLNLRVAFYGSMEAQTDLYIICSHMQTCTCTLCWLPALFIYGIVRTISR